MDRLVYLLLLLPSVFLVGCKENKEIESHGVVYCVDTSIRELNPQLYGSTPVGSSLSHQLYDRLLTINPISQRLEGQLSRKWNISRDGLRYTFYLQKGIAFHTVPWFKPSRTMNADDVLFSFNRILDSSHPYHSVSGGHYPFFERVGFDKQISTLKKIDDYTIEFVLKRPNAAFISDLASDFAVILSAEYATQLQLQQRQKQFDHLVVGTGPYLLGEIRSDEFIRMHANQNYWSQVPSLQRLVFDYTPKPTKRLAKLLTGECQVMANPAATQLAFIQNKADLTIDEENNLNTAYLALNTTKFPLSDLRIRRAMSAAINKENIVSAVYYTSGESTNNLLPPVSWAYNPNLPESNYDPAKARVLLQDIHQGSTNIELLVQLGSQTYNPNPFKTAQLIQADLAQIGIEVKITQLNGYLLRKRILTNNYDAILTGWNAETVDPDNFLRPLLTCKTKQVVSYNYSGWCSPRFEQLLDEGISTNNIAKRIEAYQEAQELIAQELPVIPIAHAMNIYATRKSLHNLEQTTMGGLSFKRAYRD